MAKALVAGNWKMNTSLHSSEALVEDLLTLLDPPSNLKVVVCPPSLYLVPIQKKVRNSCIHLGAHLRMEGNILDYRTKSDHDRSLFFGQLGFSNKSRCSQVTLP